MGEGKADSPGVPEANCMLLIRLFLVFSHFLVIIKQFSAFSRLAAEIFQAYVLL
jgi:hypothetical protein